jgi:hypothetical protein
MKTCVHVWQYLAEFFLEWEMFQTKVVKKSKLTFLFNNLFPKIVPFIDSVDKYSRDG